MQQIIHLEYLNDTFPTEYKDSFKISNNIVQPNFTFKVAVDFFLAEPLLILEPNPGDLVKVRIEMTGNITCSATGVKTVSCVVDLTGDVDMPVIMITSKDTKTIQFGLDSQQAFISFFKATISSGKNPKQKYGFEVSDAAIQLSLLHAVYAIKPDQFLISVPSLNQFLQVNYILIGPAVVITGRQPAVGVQCQIRTRTDINTRGAMNSHR